MEVRPRKVSICPAGGELNALIELELRARYSLRKPTTAVCPAPDKSSLHSHVIFISN
jgi:hypothetical protein